MKLLLLCCALLLLVSGCLGETAEKKTAEAISTDLPAYKMTAIDLYNEYDANGVAADAKYKDRVIEVTGTVGSIDKDVFDTPYVSLTLDEYGMTAVQCMFGDTAAISSLAKGQNVTIKGKCDGFLVWVIMRGCTLAHL